MLRFQSTVRYVPCRPSASLFLLPSNSLYSQDLDRFTVCEYLNIPRTVPLASLLFLSPQILSYLVLAASSLMIVLRVCVLFSSGAAFSKPIAYARIAIWDRNKTIVVIATGIWGTNIVFLIQGKFLPPLPPWNDRESHSVLGAMRVNDHII